MIPPYDIFRTDIAGLCWLEAAATIEGAKARVQDLAARSPGEYFVVSQITGNELMIKLDSASAVPAHCSEVIVKGGGQ